MGTQDFVVPHPSGVAANGMVSVIRDAGSFPKESWESLKTISLCGILNNAAENKGENGEDNWTGSPTEVAIMRACTEVHGGASRARESKRSPENAHLFEIPFN